MQQYIILIIIKPRLGLLKKKHNVVLVMDMSQTIYSNQTLPVSHHHMTITKDALTVTHVHILKTNNTQPFKCKSGVSYLPVKHSHNNMLQSDPCRKIIANQEMILQ